MTYNGSFPRDANRVADPSHGVLSTTKHNMTGNNTTVNDPIFTVTGAIEVLGLWGVVTVVLGANHTTAFFRGNDGSNTPAITLATGTTLSAANVGSIFTKAGLAAAAVTLIKSDQMRIAEPTTLETTYFSPFVLNAKNGTTSNIEYSYATTDTPTSGQIQFFMRWLPLSINAAVTPLTSL